MLSVGCVYVTIGWSKDVCIVGEFGGLGKYGLGSVLQAEHSYVDKDAL